MCARCELTTTGEASCDRPAVVWIVDRIGGSRRGCDRHGVRALRAIEGARVYPLTGEHDAYAIAVYLSARGEGRP